MSEPSSESSPAVRTRKDGGAWVHLGSVRGVGIYVDPILVLFLGLIILLGDGTQELGSRLALIGILLGSVLWHELGHAWMARRRGLAVTGVFLHILPFAYVQRGKPEDEYRVALAGPAASFLLFLVLAGILAATEGLPPLAWAAWSGALLPMAAGVNLLMGTVNLLPIIPLDGGRALRAVLMARLDAPTARSMTARVGTFFGVGLIALAVFLWRMPVSGYVGVIGVWICVVAWREAAR